MARAAAEKIWENFSASARYWVFSNVYISRGTWEAGTHRRVARAFPSLGVGHSGVAFARTQRIDGLHGATEPGGMFRDGATARSEKAREGHSCAHLSGCSAFRPACVTTD